MNKEEMIKKTADLCGGLPNIRKSDLSGKELVISFKDAGLVDPDSVCGLEFVESCELRRDRIHIVLKEQFQEEKRMAKDYKVMAQDIIEQAGGKENITFATHCMTRLRLNVKDEKLVNDEEIKKIYGVLGSQFSGGQYQIIIGQDVPKLYDALCEEGNFSKQEAIDENLDKKPFNIKTLPNDIMNALSGCLTPIIPVLMAAGMLKMIVAVFGPGMLNVLSETSDTYRILTLAGDAGFYYFPALVAYTGSKKFGGNTVIAIMLAGILLHPSMLSIVAGGGPIKVFGFPMTLVDYGSSVIPMVLITFVQAKIEALLKKYVPTVLSTVFTPLLTVLIMLPLGLCVLGPLGSFIATYLGMFLNWLYNIFGPVGIAVVAALWFPVVATGMHLPIVSLVLMNFATLGYDYLLSGAMTGIYAGAAVDLVFALKAKNAEDRSVGWSCLASQLLGGVGEPAIYGIYFRYKKCMLWCMIGAFFGGLYCGIMKVYMYTISASNILCAICFAGGPSSANLINGIIGCVIAAIVAFVLCWVFGYEDKKTA